MIYNNYNGMNGYASPYYSQYNRPYQQYAAQQQLQQMQQQMQPQMPSQQQFRPQEMPIQGIKFLTADEVKAYIVMPNSKEMLIDTTNSMAYIKSADPMGQSSTRMFRFEEINEEQIRQAVEAQKQPQIDLSGYAEKKDLDEMVTRSDLDEFSKQLEDKIGRLEKKIKISEIMEGK